MGLCAVGSFLAVVGGGQVVVEAVPFLRDSSWLPNLVGGMEVPMLSHAFVALFFVAALFFAASDRRVLQLPHFRLVSVFGAFICVLSLSITISQHKNLSVMAFLEWCTYLMAMVAVVMTVGRGRGPEVVMSGIGAGGSVLALLGLREYAVNKVVDPNWRIFSTWNNPNALAGILVVAFFACVAVAVLSPKPRNLVWGLGAGIIGLALFLTQSKGGFLSLLVGAGVWVVVGGLKAGMKPMLRGLVPIALVFALTVGLVVSQKSQAASSAGTSVAGSRIVDLKGSADQSAGFRKQLWKSTILLTQQQPTGVGLGTYRFHSSRVGLVTQTQFAHNSYLQLGAEATVLAPLILFAGLGLWFRAAWKTSRDHWESHRVLTAGVFSALAASLAHNMVDSDLYFFGSGLIFFVLLGIGLQVAVDGSTPEFMPKNVRFPVVMAGSVLVLFGLSYFAYESAVKSAVLGARKSQDEAGMTAGLATLQGIAWKDSEASYMLGLYPPKMTPDERIPFIKRSIDEGPNQRSSRLLAKLYLSTNKQGEAIGVLTDSLRQDPNNLTTLTVLADAYKQNGDPTKENETLDRLITVENSEYFKIRSLPELVPLETYDARVRRAATLSGQAQADMLLPALTGYSEFVMVALPRLLNGSLLPDMYVAHDSNELLTRVEQSAGDAIKMLKATGRTDAQIGDMEQLLRDARKKVDQAQKPQAE